MRRMGHLASFGLISLSLWGCAPDAVHERYEKILAIEETELWSMPELEGPVYVVRTEHNVPHVYAHNRNDMGFVYGFVTARDRFFMMDLARRLGRGKLSELLGDAALEIDQESRGTGLTFTAQQIAESFTPEQAAYIDSFAAGINAYIDRVGTSELPAPSEADLAKILLAVTKPTDVMARFERIDVAAIIAVILYDSSYETGDIGRAATAVALPTLFEGAVLGDLRRKGAMDDMWQDVRPIHEIASAPGFYTQVKSAKPYGTVPSHVPLALIERLAERLEKQQRRLQRDREAGYGSNAWAVSGDVAVGGHALMAGDGHLSLAVPSLLFRIGLDTSIFGGGEIHQLGLVIPGMPVVGLGTNGKVAWSQTQLSGDITDWYAEQLDLDASGLPARSRFEGQWRGLVAIDEVYHVAEVELLDSVGRKETWARWETFDGRWIADIEGRSASITEPLAAGESLVNLQGAFVVPGDTNGDGIISAISFDYAAFDAGPTLTALEGIGLTDDVHAFTEVARSMVATSLNYAAADSQGDIVYGAFQAFPCRAFLERNADGSWADGSDPNLLLDGTRFGAWEIPSKGQVVDRSPSSDPYRCAVPDDGIPVSINPAQGYVVTANNDPGGATFDNNLTNETWYIGGPWTNGFRTKTIADGIEKAVAEGTADVAKMAEIQGDTHSTLGELFTLSMLASIDHARGLSAPTDEADQRALALYDSEKADIDDVYDRLTAWMGNGFQTPSGVVTFYNPELGPNDEEDSIATMLFNAWMSRVQQGVFDDEGLPGVFRSGGHGRIRALDRFLRGRGAANTLGIASHNPATGESVFFDVLATPEIEGSHEVVLKALVDTLLFLRSAPDEEDPFTGGYGTSDMTQWIWGRRHYVKFESLLADFIGGDSEFGAITNEFAINTDQLPLKDGGVSESDPLFGLAWFPRQGDNYSVDAGNPGTSGVRFSYNDGPVMRMVIAPDGDDTVGINIIPGGQSALTDSPYFADQARLWLANETSPMRFSVEQVVEGASGRETYTP